MELHSDDVIDCLYPGDLVHVYLKSAHRMMNLTLLQSPQNITH